MPTKNATRSNDGIHNGLTKSKRFQSSMKNVKAKLDDIPTGAIKKVPWSTKKKVIVIGSIAMGVICVCAAIIIPCVLLLRNTSLDCTTIASNFNTTCGSYTTAVSSITATTGISVSCTSGFTSATCPGTMSGSTCTFYHKLCVTCSGNPVRIRVQSNGLPRFCPNSPATISEQDIDFAVNFNPTVSINSLNQNLTTASALSSVVCNIQNQAMAPSASSLTVYGSQIDTVAGVSIDGVAIMNANSANDVDPFYPTGGYAAETVDACLGHPNTHNIYHYHMASGCALNPPSGAILSCAGTSSCSSNIATYGISLFSSYKSLTVIGIAKDGHVIYGPYDSTGTQVTSGFDVCNGMFYNSNGDYGYFATQTFPYITGCFGPGSYPNASVNCSTDAPSSYTKSKYAGQAISIFASSRLLLIYNIIFLMIMGIFLEQ